MNLSDRQYLHIIHLCHCKVSSHIILKLDADIKVYKYFSFKDYNILISKASRMSGQHSGSIFQTFYIQISAQRLRIIVLILSPFKQKIPKI